MPRWDRVHAEWSSLKASQCRAESNWPNKAEAMEHLHTNDLTWADIVEERTVLHFFLKIIVDNDELMTREATFWDGVLWWFIRYEVISRRLCTEAQQCFRLNLSVLSACPTFTMAVWYISYTSYRTVSTVHCSFSPTAIISDQIFQPRVVLPSVYSFLIEGSPFCFFNYFFIASGTSQMYYLTSNHLRRELQRIY